MTAIQINHVPETNTRPTRLKASTMAALKVSVTVSYWTDKAECEDDRYAYALETLLAKLGDGWGTSENWAYGDTDKGRVYVRKPKY